MTIMRQVYDVFSIVVKVLLEREEKGGRPSEDLSCKEKWLLICFVCTCMEIVGVHVLCIGLDDLKTFCF